MRKMNPMSKSGAIRPIALSQRAAFLQMSGLLLAMLFVSFGVGASSATKFSYKIPALDWLKAYVAYLDANNLEIDPTFNSPSIWLFSPNGAMVGNVNATDDPDLRKLRSSFPFDPGAKKIPGTLTRNQALELLSKVLATDDLPVLGDDDWFAVLFLANSPDCSHCAIFDSEMIALEQAAKGKVKTVRVTAEF